MMQVLGLAPDYCMKMEPERVPDQSMMKAPELALGWRRKQAPDQSMKIVPEPVPDQNLLKAPEPAPG